jgi:hypothetical protein
LIVGRLTGQARSTSATPNRRGSRSIALSTSWRFAPRAQLAHPLLELPVGAEQPKDGKAVVDQAEDVEREQVGTGEENTG